MNDDASTEAAPVKLLLDENLSARLVADLQEHYPGTAHLETVGLLGATDRIVWRHAADHGFVLVTKDSDFHRLSVMLGPPPKVVWVRLGNCTRAEVAALLIESLSRVELLVADPDVAFLGIGK